MKKRNNDRKRPNEEREIQRRLKKIIREEGERGGERLKK